MTAVILPVYIRPEEPVPPFPYYYDGPFLSTGDLYSGITDDDLDALMDGQMTSNVTGDTITLSAPGAGDYMYMLSPVYNGAITFTDTATNIIGGWDGASWPDNDIGESYGPVVISVVVNGTPEDWYVYRTDFPGIGNKTWRLSYAR